MRFEGVLSAWNPDAGYGAIRPLGGGDEVFVGLAAFPMDGDGPRLDEPFSFEIATTRDGRKQAVNLQRLQRSQLSSAMKEAVGVGRQRRLQAQRKRRLAWAAGAVVVVMLLGLGGWQWWRAASQAGDVPAAMRR